MDDVVFPGLAENGDYGGGCVDQHTQLCVVLGAYSGAARTAEGRQFRVVQRHGLHTLEESSILGIGARPAAFDIVHAELIESPRNTNLILHAVGDALALRTVAEGRVIDFDRPAL